MPASGRSDHRDPTILRNALFFAVHSLASWNSRQCSAMWPRRLPTAPRSPVVRQRAVMVSGRCRPFRDRQRRAACRSTSSSHLLRHRDAATRTNRPQTTNSSWHHAAQHNRDAARTVDGSDAVDQLIACAQPACRRRREITHGQSIRGDCETCTWRRNMHVTAFRLLALSGPADREHGAPG